MNTPPFSGDRQQRGDWRWDERRSHSFHEGDQRRYEPHPPMGYQQHMGQQFSASAFLPPPPMPPPSWGRQERAFGQGRPSPAMEHDFQRDGRGPNPRKRQFNDRDDSFQSQPSWRSNPNSSFRSNDSRDYRREPYTPGPRRPSVRKP